MQSAEKGKLKALITQKCGGKQTTGQLKEKQIKYKVLQETHVDQQFKWISVMKLIRV